MEQWEIAKRRGGEDNNKGEGSQDSGEGEEGKKVGVAQQPESVARDRRDATNVNMKRNTHQIGSIEDASCDFPGVCVVLK